MPDAPCILIPHYSDPTTYTRSETLGVHSAKVPAGSTSRSTVAAISHASFVLAGSLHAGVVAYSVGTPFAFFASGFRDNPIKYEDFGSMFGLPAESVDGLTAGIEQYLDTAAAHDPLSLDHIDVLLSPVRDLLVDHKLTQRRRLFKWLERHQAVRRARLRVLPHLAR